jgi:hypothetical protein
MLTFDRVGRPSSMKYTLCIFLHSPFPKRSTPFFNRSISSKLQRPPLGDGGKLPTNLRIFPPRTVRVLVSALGLSW